MSDEAIGHEGEGTGLSVGEGLIAPHPGPLPVAQSGNGARGAGRYDRQVLLPMVGVEGQRRLAAAHVVVVGCGALGCGVADHLARAGVGRLTIIDRDVVEETNLQRQVLFDGRHVARALPKAEAARERLAEINPGVEVVSRVADLTFKSVHELMRVDARIDALIDGTDNFETRLLINDLAVSRAVPYVYGGVVGTRGTVMTVVPGGACLRCLVERVPAPGATATCDTAGVLGPAVGVVTALQAAEIMRVIVGVGGGGSLVEVDAWTGEHRRMESARLHDPECACCGGRDFAYLDGRAGGSASVLCGRGSVQVTPGAGGERVSLESAMARIPRAWRVASNEFLVRFRPEGERGDDGMSAVEVTVFRDGRAIVSGTGRVERARAIYARYVGG